MAPAIPTRAADEAVGTTSAEGSLDAAAGVVNALGVAFATYQLFEAVEAQLAFTRAVEALGPSTQVRVLEVASDHFLWRRQQVDAGHPGAARLAARLFAHGVAAIRFHGPPGPRDLRGSFDAVAGNPDPAHPPGVTLSASGIRTIELLDRAPLAEAPDEEDVDAPDTVWGEQAAFDPSAYLGDPAAFAGRLIEEAGGDDARLVSLVTETYLASLDELGEEDVWGREELVHTFVDAFFHLPRKVQGSLLADLLARREAPEFVMFLDQFAHHELQEMAPILDSGSHPLLLEYARMAAADGQPRLDELALLVEDTRSSRPPVAARISQMLKGSTTPPARQAANRLREERAGSPRGEAASVMSGLLRLSADPKESSRRLLIWARKLAATVHAGDMDAVDGWARIVFDDPGLDVTPAQVSEAIAAAATRETAADLIGMVGEEEGADERLLLLIGSSMTSRLVDVLGDEGDARRRRRIIRMLTHAAKTDPTELVDSLDDARWYLVRNLVLILGRSGRPEVAGRVRDAADHPDPRVRREVVRAVHALEGASDTGFFLRHLTDDDPTVRAAASTVLRTERQLGTVPGVAGVVEGAGPSEIRAEAVALLGSIGTPEARAALERLSAKKLDTGRAGRALRDAIRAELEVAP